MPVPFVGKTGDKGRLRGVARDPFRRADRPGLTIERPGRSTRVRVPAPGLVRSIDRSRRGRSLGIPAPRPRRCDHASAARAVAKVRPSSARFVAFYPGFSARHGALPDRGDVAASSAI